LAIADWPWLTIKRREKEVQVVSKMIVSGGRLVLPSGVRKTDLLIEDEKIAAVGDSRHFGHADHMIDASGRIVLPGLVDVHVHFLDRFMGSVSLQDYFSGTKSAAFGGVTTIIDFAHQEKGQSLAQAIQLKREEADGHVTIDYGLHAGITDPTPETLSEMRSVIRSGIPSFKVYTIYDDFMIDDGSLLAVFEEAVRQRGLVMLHAENDKIAKYRVREFLGSGKTSAVYHALSKPNIVEEEAIQRVALLARSAGAPFYVVHLSTREGKKIIEEYRKQGFPAFSETCTHYLCLTDEVYEQANGINYIISPPLRKEQDLIALWGGLVDGSISVVSSDDCSFSDDAKLMGKDSFDRVPNGMAGVELRLPFLYSEGVRKGRISLERLAEITSTNPARIFGLFPRKGVIQPDADADLVLLDPDKEVTMSLDSIHMAADFCFLEGKKLKGYPVMTISRGKVIIQDNRFIGHEGDGRFIERKIDFRAIKYLR
jgi:dihydropyrimidinase